MPSFFYFQTMLYLKRALVLALLLIVGWILYWAVQSEDWKKVRNSLKKLDADPGLVTPETSSAAHQFKEFLDNATVQQLILKSTELVDSPDYTLVERLDRQDSRIRVAERLMAHTDDLRAVSYGISVKLSSLRNRETISFEHGLSSRESLDELQAFAQKHQLKNDANIASQADLGSLHASLYQAMIAPSADQAGVGQKIIKNFQQFCARYLKDELVPGEIYKLLERIYVHAKPDDYLTLSQIFQNTFQNSPHESVQDLASAIGEQLKTTEIELVDILDEIESRREQTAALLRDQILEALEQRQLSQHAYESMFSRIKELASVGRYDIANELATMLQNRIAPIPFLEPMSATLDKFRRQLTLVGMPFSTQALLDVEDQPFKLRFPAADVKAICFITEQDLKAADSMLFAIMQIAGRYVDSKRFCLTAVYIDHGTSPQARDEMKKISSLLPTIDFCRLDAQSENGKAALESLALLATPMLMLLDRDDMVVGLNVAQIDFEKRFFEILSSKNRPATP